MVVIKSELSIYIFKYIYIYVYMYVRVDTVLYANVSNYIYTPHLICYN